MMLDGLKLAFGTLTAIPVPAPARIDRPVAGRAMALAPLTQLPLVFALLLWGWVVREVPVPPLMAAAVPLVAISLPSRGSSDRTEPTAYAVGWVLTPLPRLRGMP